MHHLKWSHTDNDVEKYECLTQTLQDIEKYSFANDDSDCKSLIRLACMLFLQKNNLTKYFTNVSAMDNHINKYWLRKKRFKNVKMENMWATVKKMGCDNSMCMSDLFKTHCS